jgi:TrmH family RNA methyltransferase
MPLTGNALKNLRKLGNKKFRDQQDRFLIEGVRLLQEAVESDFEILEAYCTEEFLRDPAAEPLVQKLRKKARTLEQASARSLAAVSDTVSPQGVVAVLARRKVDAVELLKSTEAESIVVALDSVTDPGNLGSIVRTCDWFGVHAVLIGEKSVDLYNPKVIRATMGGLFHLAIAENVNLPSALSRAREQGYSVYVTDLKGEAHFDQLHYARKSVLVFGNEAWGVSDDLKALADTRIAIRRYGAAESLNVGVACGVVLSALHRLTNE